MILLRCIETREDRSTTLVTFSNSLLSRQTIRSQLHNRLWIIKKLWYSQRCNTKELHEIHRPWLQPQGEVPRDYILEFRTFITQRATLTIPFCIPRCSLSSRPCRLSLRRSVSNEANFQPKRNYWNIIIYLFESNVWNYFYVCALCFVSQRIFYPVHRPRNRWQWTPRKRTKWQVRRKLARSTLESNRRVSPLS